MVDNAPSQKACQAIVRGLLVQFEGAVLYNGFTNDAARTLVQEVLRTERCDAFLKPSMRELRDMYLEEIGLPAAQILSDDDNKRIDKHCGAAVAVFQ